MKNILIIIGTILLILVLAGLGVYYGFRQLSNSVVNPIQAANSDMKTQVAAVLHPTPTILPDPVTIVNEVKVLARLETIQYSVEKVVTAETGQEILAELFGDRLLLIAHGVVIAGVDLSDLSRDDISIFDGVVMVDLPDPEIFIATLDNQKSSVYDRETGLFRKGDPDLETLARQAAEQEIYQAAVEDGILQQANDNAEIFIERLLNDLGYEDVIFTPYVPLAIPTPTLIPES
jgi:hypothetical protein